MRPKNTTAARRTTRREAYTLIELVIVIAMLVILGAVLVPTLSSYYSNAHQKDAADIIRSRIVEARAKAMEQGIWYRVAINQDKTRIRVAPDTQNFSSVKPDDPAGPSSKNTEDKFDKTVTAEVSYDPNDPRSSNNTDDWTTVTTIGPEGICREQYNTTVTVKESNFQHLLIQVRGLVGNAAIVPAPKNGSK